jgi:hypothetical protein
MMLGYFVINAMETLLIVFSVNLALTLSGMASVIALYVLTHHDQYRDLLGEQDDKVWEWLQHNLPNFIDFRHRKLWVRFADVLMLGSFIWLTIISVLVLATINHKTKKVTKTNE